MEESQKKIKDEVLKVRNKGPLEDVPDSIYIVLFTVPDRPFKEGQYTSYQKTGPGWVIGRIGRVPGGPLHFWAGREFHFLTFGTLVHLLLK